MMCIVLNKLAEIRERSNDIKEKWNVLWAQADRAWLLKHVEELQARVDALERERAAGDAMVNSIMAVEDKRILEVVDS